MMDNKEDLRDDLGLSPAETAIAADLRAAFLVEPDPATAERHIAAMVAAREAIRAPSVISLAGHRSRKAIAAAGLVGAVVLGSAGVAAASGGLPDPIQRVVASVGRPIGIHLPTPATTVAHDSGSGDNEKPSTPPSTESSGSPSSVPGNGDDNRADPGKGVEATTPSPNANPRATPGTPPDHPKPTVTTPKPKSPSDGNGKDNGGNSDGNSNNDGNGNGKSDGNSSGK
ncbi:MAG TPA: hypothetical protein VIJ47_08995 [Acidimicrobiales bacterium]